MRPDWLDIVVIVGTALALIIMMNLQIIHNGNRLDDLDKRITTHETITIERIARPEGVSP